jgi:hypothetical protein
MSKFAGWVLMVLMAVSGVAQAGGKKTSKYERWEAVAALRPGMEIDVLSGDEAGAEPCLVSSVDDSALTCLREDPLHDTRLVFPRSAVRQVEVWDVAHGWTAVTWVRVVLGSALAGVAAACIVANPLCVLPMGVVALVLLSGPEMGPYPMPPAPPRMGWRLVYRSVTP